uniref:hypothetical protein n=1 Tax=Segatella hominis TaxID=2518605 RepID=UPI00402976D2
MDRIQNEISKLRHEQHLNERLQADQLRQIKLEHDGRHKWVRLSKGRNNLKQLCQVDENGNLLPQEEERIRNIKKILGIK